MVSRAWSAQKEERIGSDVRGSEDPSELEFCIRCAQWSHGLVLSIHDNGRVFSRCGSSVNDEPTPGDVNHPIFDDARTCVEICLNTEIEAECAIGNLDDELQIVRLRIAAKGSGLPGQYDRRVPVHSVRYPRD